jgi:uncharacterized membrane protein
MNKFAAAYLGTLLSMVALDLLWLAVIAAPLYQAGIGHLMAAEPRAGVAGLFYLVYAAGIVVFAIVPQAADTTLRRAAAMGALFGFFAYATYDLSNLATLRDWPLGISVLDIGWGCCVSAVAAAAGRLALNRFPAG